MNKKLIITEEQYKNLKFFLLESTFFEMADTIIKKGDTITITTSGKKLNFNVVENFQGQLYMDNIDKDSEYFGKRIFLNKMSFDNNNLEIQVAKDDEQKNEKPLKGNTWQKMTLKNVDEITVSRNGKMLDGTNYDVNAEKNKKQKNRFIESISTLNDGDAISLETDGKIKNIVLDFMSKSSGFVHFELSEETKDALGNPNITGVDISLNEKDIEVTKNGLLNVNIITYESKDGNMEKKESKIQNIAEFSVTNVEDKPKEEEKPEEEKPEDTEDDFDAKKVFDILANDTELRNAFYKRPSFWRSFTAELKGEKPKTTGYTYVKNLLNNYMDDEATKKLGKNFLHQGKISFRPLEEVNIRWTENKKNRIMSLNSNNIMTVNWKRSEPSESGEYYTLLQNNEIDILVKEKGDKPNTYICDIFKKYKTTQLDDEGEKVTKIVRSEPAEDITVEFLKSPGYRLDKEENKNI